MKWNFIFAFVASIGTLGSVEAQRREYERPWERDVREIENAPVTITRSKINQEPAEKTVSARVYRLVYKPAVQDIRYAEYDENCEDTGGDGSTGNWFNAWGFWQDDRARALSDAIKGLDYYTARYIVEDGRFLNSRPTSWRKFKNQFRQIDAAYGTWLYNTVVLWHASENQTNLGYQLQCDPIWTTDRIDYYEISRKLVDEEFRRVKVEFRGGFFLPGEEESFELRLDGKRVKIREGSALHDYSFQSVDPDYEAREDDLIIATAKSRHPIKARWENATADLKMNGRKFELSFRDRIFNILEQAPEEMGIKNPETELEITLKSFWGTEILKVTQSVNDDGRLTLDLASIKSFKTKRSYYAELRFRRQGGRALSEDWSTLQPTNSEKYAP